MTRDRGGEKFYINTYTTQPEKKKCSESQIFIARSQIDRWIDESCITYDFQLAKSQVLDSVEFLTANDTGMIFKFAVHT